MSVRRRTLRSVALAAVGLTGWGAAPALAAGSDPLPAPPGPVESAKSTPALGALSPHSQNLLVRAQAAGKKTVTVMALGAPGGSAALAGQLTALGGTVGHRQDKLGYVRATLPVGKVAEAARLQSVQSMDLDEMLRVPKPQQDPSTKAAGSMPWSGPGPKTPVVNPYMPISETGATTFRAQHPTWDGRGVTVGVLDSGVDLDHPALQKTTTGEAKITDWVTATDPLLEADPTWRPMLTKVSGASAQYNGATWKLPAGAGDYAINVFKEASALNDEEIQGDINRDGDTTDSWGVLYDYKTNDIWVDADGNHEFTDGERMRPFAEKRQVGHFGTDDPKTQVVERMPFVVEFRKNVDLSPAGLNGRTADFVNIGVPSGAHGSHVAGISTGNGLFGGAMTGAAPGAKIVSAKACVFDGGCTAVALTEGMITLIADKKVDVVNLSIGGLPALNDGNNTRARLYDRLIDTYGVQIFVSAGNSGPGENTIGDPGLATDVVGVGASASKDTWKANYGADVTAPLWAQNYSSRGPREDGGFKPNIMAPGSAISTVPTWLKPDDIPQVSYKLPAGYAMFNGTSMASPEATGAAALLLSAARAADRPVLPKELRESIYSSAKFVPGLGASVQGNGQMDIIGAYKLLAAGTSSPAGYTITAPVCTPLSDMLAEKNRGSGLYNRCAAEAGGQAAGSKRSYDVTITRTSGAAGNLRHDLRWVGNDGTFTSPKSVNLPLGQAVTVKVQAAPRTVGLHDAYLAIDAPSTRLVDARMMAAVIAPVPMTTPPFGQNTSASVQRARTVSYFVSVPEKAKALQVDLSGIAPGSQVRWTAMNPYGMPVDTPTGKGSCYTNDRSDPKVCNATSRSYADPMPGVWEIQVEAKRTTPFTSNPFTIRGAAQGVTVTPAEQKIATATVGKPVPLKWTVRDDFGDVTVAGRGGPLGSARTQRPSIKTGEKQQYTVDVPAGAATFTAAIKNPADQKADLDLYVYDAAGNVVGKSATGGSDESVTLTKPAAGTYRVEVEGYDVPAASGMAYDYLDMFTSSTLGTLDVDSTPVKLTRGKEVTISGSLTAAAPAASGRRLVGDMTVVSDKDAVLGTGRVVVDAVTGAPAPTQSPTATPTSAPTQSPTATPTPAPTSSTTPAPTPSTGQATTNG